LNKILITGGAGFIGSHLAEKYLELGNEVYIIDNLATSSLEKINRLQDNKNYKDRIFITIDDILNRDVLMELIGTCDVVFHLAAAVGVKYILDNPLSSITTNIRGTENVLELCHKFKKKMLIASTSEVYGKHTHSPLVESDNVVYGPSFKLRWSYAAAKLMDELTAMAYFRTYGLPILIIRLFNTIGPGQRGRYGMVVPTFVEQAIENKPITIFGDGSQSRTFTYVGDVVDAFIKLVDCQEAFGKVVNLGGTEEITILELANRIKELTNSKSKLKFIPYDKVYSDDYDDMQRRVPSIKLINKLIGYKPRYELDNILLEIIKYFNHKKKRI